MSIDVTRLMARQKSIDGNPFDFQYWRTWLSQRAEELQNTGFEAQHSLNDLGSKPLRCLCKKRETRWILLKLGNK